MDRDKVMDAYLDHLLTEGKRPASVYAFCKGLEITESAFFEHFPSFDAVEGEIWRSLVEKARADVEADGEYTGLSARQKMLALFYAFFEQASGRRSFLLKRYPGFACANGDRRLRRLKDAFEPCAGDILREAAEREEIAERGRLNEAYPYLFYQLLLFILDYNLKDASQGFERTDALIEKLVNLAFDLLEQQVIESTFDVLRFLAQKTPA